MTESAVPINIPIVPVERPPRDELHRLAQLRPYIFVLDFLFDLAVIAAAVAVSEYFFFNPFAYIAAVIVIGSRLNALSVLMHDTAHFRAFRSKKLNYIFGEPIGWMLLATMEGYRINHQPHHKSLNTLDDPDWVRKLPQKSFYYPKKPHQLALDILKQVSGIGFFDLLLFVFKSKALKAIPRRIKIARAVFYVALISLLIYTHTLDKFLLYWAVPLVTVFTLLLWLRSLAEHLGNLEYDHAYTYARTMLVSWWEAFILSPHGINYHMEHHLYPHIPYYNLPQLHALLMEQPTYRAKAHVTRGIFKGLLKELCAAPVGPSFAEMIRRQQEARAV